MSSDIDPIVLNLIYVATGGLMTLFFMWMGCKVFSHIVNFIDLEKLSNQLVKEQISSHRHIGESGYIPMGFYITIQSTLDLFTVDWCISLGDL